MATPTTGLAVAPPPEALGQARLDHLGIAVADLSAACALYRTMLGVEPQMHSLPSQGIEVAMFALPNLRIELLAPIGAESPIEDVLEEYTIQAFMARQPEGGLHHVCYVVPDIAAAQPPGTRRLGTGVPLIGVQGLPIVFLDPKTTGGALIELKEQAPPSTKP